MYRIPVKFMSFIHFISRLILVIRKQQHGFCLTKPLLLFSNNEKWNKDIIYYQKQTLLIEIMIKWKHFCQLLKQRWQDRFCSLSNKEEGSSGKKKKKSLWLHLAHCKQSFMQFTNFAETFNGRHLLLIEETELWR